MEAKIDILLSPIKHKWNNIKAEANNIQSIILLLEEVRNLLNYFYNLEKKLKMAKRNHGHILNYKMVHVH